MNADPRAALEALTLAFERHLEACSARRGDDDPAVIAASDALADAFETYDMDKLVEATTDYSGAELEQAVIASLYDAFDTGNDLTTEGLLATLRDIVPLAITMREQIESMREWARTRARMAATRGRNPEKKEGWMARYGAPTANLGDKGPETDDGERKLEL